MKVRNTKGPYLYVWAVTIAEIVTRTNIPFHPLSLTLTILAQWCVSTTVIIYSANHLLGDARLAPTGEGCYPTTPLPKLNHSSTVVPKPNCRYLQSWPYNAGLDRWHCEADFTRPTQGEPPIGPQKGANLPGYTFRKKSPPQRTLTSGRSREPTLKPPRYGHT